MRKPLGEVSLWSAAAAQQVNPKAKFRKRHRTDVKFIQWCTGGMSSLLRRGPLRSPNLAHLDSGTSPHSTSFCLSTKGGGNFGRIVPVLPLAATTSGISPRSGPDDSLLAFSLIRSSSALHPGS